MLTVQMTWPAWMMVGVLLLLGAFALGNVVTALVRGIISGAAAGWKRAMEEADREQ